MKVELLHNTPLHVCARAIRTCWDSHDKSDTNGYECGEKDKALIERVGNKQKHSSTLEHLCLCVKIDDNNIAQTFKENKYSTVTGVSDGWIISTNVRALQEINLPIEIKHLLVPEEYIYLF